MKLQKYYEHIQKDLDKQIAKIQEEMTQRRLSEQEETIKQIKENLEKQILIAKEEYSEYPEILEPMLQSIKKQSNIEVNTVLTITKFFLDGIKKIAEKDYKSKL